MKNRHSRRKNGKDSRLGYETMLGRGHCLRVLREIELTQNSIPKKITLQKMKQRSVSGPKINGQRPNNRPNIKRNNTGWLVEMWT